MYAAFYSRSAAYSKNPKTPGGFFFDLETMKPLINNPGFVEASTKPGLLISGFIVSKSKKKPPGVLGFFE